jgi:uncharacterized Zn finger protein
MDSVADLVEPVKLEVRATAQAFEKGKEIAANNGVTVEEFNPIRVKASVSAPSGVQHTELNAMPDGLKWSCTCNDKHTFCEHLVATAIVAWEKAPKRRQNPKAGQSPA